jgi:predicted RNase H-like HicB family nuclease
MKRYTVVLVPDAEEGGYTVTVPALPGCITEGETREEALMNAPEAIQLYLEDLTAHGEPIPVEKAHPDLATVEVA